MPRFALNYPYFIIVCCLMAMVLGAASLVRMPVALFPDINIPVVVAATFYQGMPPEQVEIDITSRFERMFTLAPDIEHLESRSLPGVSVIRAFFHPGSNPFTALTSISNLTMAQLGHLPKGTLPPVVLKFDAAMKPVCLVTFKGRGLGEKELLDIARYNVRNQIASVQGASVPIPFGGKARQIQVYVDPLKVQAYDMSIMDVVRGLNRGNQILPAGFTRIGDRTYNLYTNSLVRDVTELSQVPIRTVGQAPVLVSDLGEAKDSHAIQTNIVRVDGQASVYLPILKQGGSSNAISIVEGVRNVIKNLLDVPKTLVTKVVFDESDFIKSAIENLEHEGLTGLVLTSLMILLFLGNLRATTAVMLSIPLSSVTAFLLLSLSGGSINTMTLGGLALAFSRLIDDSVVVLENIFRRMETGEAPRVAAEHGGQEVAMPALAAALTTSIVVLPVTFLSGVSRFLFSALGLVLGLAVLASYVVAMTVVPLFCAKFIRVHSESEHKGGDAHSNSEPSRTGRRPFRNWGRSFRHRFDQGFESFRDHYQRLLSRTLKRPALTVLGILGIFVASLALGSLLGVSYFPRTDAAQFTIMVNAPAGMRLEKTTEQIAQVEQIIRRTVSKKDLDLIVSNIGTQTDIPAIYTTNSTENTAFVQVGLKPDHETGSYEYMKRVADELRSQMPQLEIYMQAGGPVEATVNQGAPAPIDVQVSGRDLGAVSDVTKALAKKIRALHEVSGVFTPQTVDLPALRVEVDRVRAGQVGLSQQDVVDNVITALTSNVMIAPNYWLDRKTSADYFLTAQYPLSGVKSIIDLKNLMLRGPQAPAPTSLQEVATVREINAPNEVDHYQIRRVMDVYVTPHGEDLGALASAIDHIIAKLPKPENVVVTVRGAVNAMKASFVSFAEGLALSIVLVYLVLVAQFKSFIDPVIILLAVPTGLTGAILLLLIAGTTVNIMSLMGTIMLTGIVVSNSILIVQFANQLRDEGMALDEAVSTACRTRLRPILMTSLATIIGLIPMALQLGAGSEAYAPLAQAIIGGVTVSVILTVFIVPAAYLMVKRWHDSGVSKKQQSSR